MKIVYIVSSLRQAGPVNVLYNIVSNLIGEGQHEIHIIKLSEDEAGRSITGRFESMGIKVWPLHYSKLKLEICIAKVSREVGEILDEIKPDIVHTHGYHSVLSVCNNSKWNRVETLHCIHWEYFLMSKGKLLGSWMCHRYGNAIRKMDALVAISQAVKTAYLNRGFCGENLFVACNGCDTHKFFPLPETEKIEMRRKLGIPVDKRVFVVVGTLSMLKDPLTVIRAFKRIPKDLAELLFIGKGELKDACQKEADGADNIQFCGYKMDAQHYLQAADYSICASHSEGFGLNFAESLLCGVPVVGTNIPPFREFTSFSPEIRTLEFTPGDVDALQKSLERACEEDIEMGSISREFANIYSAENMAKTYEHIYNELLKRKSNSGRTDII